MIKVPKTTTYTNRNNASISSEGTRKRVVKECCFSNSCSLEIVVKIPNSFRRQSLAHSSETIIALIYILLSKALLFLFDEEPARRSSG